MGLKEPGLRGSLRSVSTGVSAIPDSVVAQYDAQQFEGQDSQTIQTWPAEIGNDATGGDPTVVDDGINGNTALDFDGVDDEFTAALSTITQPNTIITVAELSDPNESDRMWIVDGDSNQHAVYWSNSNNAIFAGNTLSGSTEQGVQLRTGVFDGADSILREDGGQTATGDAGSNSLDGVRIGDSAAVDENWDGLIGEIIIYDAALSQSEIDSEEQRLASKWGITI